MICCVGGRVRCLFSCAQHEQLLPSSPWRQHRFIKRCSLEGRAGGSCRVTYALLGWADGLCAHRSLRETGESSLTCGGMGYLFVLPLVLRAGLQPLGTCCRCLPGSAEELLLCSLIKWCVQL